MSKAPAFPKRVMRVAPLFAERDGFIATVAPSGAPFIGGDIGFAPDGRIVFGLEAQFMTPGGPLEGTATYKDGTPGFTRVIGVYGTLSWVQSDLDSILCNIGVNGVGLYSIIVKGSPPSSGKNYAGNIPPFYIPFNISYSPGAAFSVYVGTDQMAAVKDWEFQGGILLAP